LIEEGVEAIAVCLVHAYANDEHEQAIGALIRERAPDIALTLSAELLPAVGEFERTSTSVTNAYVMPTMRQYLQRLEDGFKDLGATGALLVMQSNGGVMTAAQARQRPAHVIESGPAAGVIAAQALARRINLPNAISVDMGGTTAKAAVVENFELTRTGEFEIGGNLSQGSRLNRGSGFLLRVPALDIAEIGAGGGSIVRVDDAGQLHVGPQSAGAIPGPACYDQGGTEATLTDANVVLGYLHGERLPSGLRLDVSRARDSLTSSVAEPLGISLLDAAFGVFQLGCARMARAVRAVTVERGRDPRDFSLIAFGGNGPLFGAELAMSLGIETVIVPAAPGLFSAVGLLNADVEHHSVRTLLRPLCDDSVPDITAALADLEKDAGSVLGASDDGSTVELLRYADLKYLGQSYELTVPFPEAWGGPDSARSLEEIFACEHERTYGHSALGDPVHVVNLRLTARAHPAVERSIASLPVGTLGSGEERTAYFGSDLGLLPTPVIGRGDLGAEPRRGPLLIDEYDATTRVPPNMAAHRDDEGNIIIRRDDSR
jgi:N-methylhydantoinase A